MRGDRQLALGRLLVSAGLKEHPGPPRPGAADLLESSLADAVMDVYRQLGGVSSTPAVRPGAWDLPFEGLIVELDEYLHFNRYRKMTLDSPAYRDLPRFPLEEYRLYCRARESECLRHGKGQKRWTRESCDSEFGVSSPPGVLDERGPSRWKQRAFYDFVKDLAPLVSNVRLARVSIWDSIVLDGRRLTVGDVLDAPKSNAKQALFELVSKRVFEPLAPG